MKPSVELLGRPLDLWYSRFETLRVQVPPGISFAVLALLAVQAKLLLVRGEAEWIWFTLLVLKFSMNHSSKLGKGAQL
jgi:hypothetical protein